MAYSHGAQKTDTLKQVSYLVLFLVYRCHNLLTETNACGQYLSQLESHGLKKFDVNHKLATS
jgi:hypothetical protein